MKLPAWKERDRMLSALAKAFTVVWPAAQGTCNLGRNAEKRRRRAEHLKPLAPHRFS